MKPFLKALSYPFRSTKQKNKQNQQTKQNNNNPIQPQQNAQKNIKSISQIQKMKVKISRNINSEQILNQVQNWVDQLGNMLNFKQLINNQQRQQLIAQLSSISVNNRNNKLVEDDLDDIQFQKNNKNQYNLDQQSNTNHQQDDQHEYQTEQNNQNQVGTALNISSSSSQNDQQPQNKPNNQCEKTKESKTQQFLASTFSSFQQIKSQMCKFWKRNSTHVFQMMAKKRQSQTHQKDYMQKKQLKKQSLLDWGANNLMTRKNDKCTRTNSTAARSSLDYDQNDFQTTQVGFSSNPYNKQTYIQ